jgi:hypothetical protein
MYRIACFLALGMALPVGTAARASGPIAGYVLVDKVILAPDDVPTTIQIWGNFCLATEKGGGTRSTQVFTSPEYGYLYYKARTGKEDVCRKEWNDLKKAAGTAQVIGFGSYFNDDYTLQAVGTAHKANEKATSPDVYPLVNGLVKVDENDNNNNPLALKLLALPMPRTPMEGDLVPPGEINLVVRNSADKKHAGAQYVFEVEGASGEKEEATVEAGDKKTSWTPKLKLKAGGKYTWRVWAVDGDWKGPTATTRFVVKG